jgi:hypothetical protein
MNFGSGGQIIALKSATALILDRCQQAKKKKYSLFKGRKMIATHKTAHLQTTQTNTQPKFAKELFSCRCAHR